MGREDGIEKLRTGEGDMGGGCGRPSGNRRIAQRSKDIGIGHGDGVPTVTLPLLLGIGKEGTDKELRMWERKELLRKEKRG